MTRHRAVVAAAATGAGLALIVLGFALAMVLATSPSVAQAMSPDVAVSPYAQLEGDPSGALAPPAAGVGAESNEAVVKEACARTKAYIAKRGFRPLASQSASAFRLERAETLSPGGGFEDAAGITFELLDAHDVADVGQLSGEVVGGFSLLGDGRLDNAEVSLEVDGSLAADGDVLELYRYNTTSWEIATYAEVVDGAFSFETIGIGTGRFAVVNLARGKAEPTVFQVVDGKHKDNFRTALGAPGVYQASAPLTIPECTINASHGVTTAHVRDTTITGAGSADQNNITIKGEDTTPDIHLYFEGCTFDAEPLILRRQGTYVFNGCTFANCPRVCVTAAGAGVNVYLFNCTVRDNKPPVDEFNANASSVRSWRYAALSYQASNVSMHVCRTTIQNFQTNPTVLVTNDRTGSRLYFEHCTMSNCGGAGIVMNSSASGRISYNTFRNIGGKRGEDGYAASANSTWGFPSGIGLGRGVGGNPVYGSTPSYHMRIVGNDIANVMENGIEGYYWCVDDNKIDYTGYRFDEGFDTVSTEAIWGGSIFVRNNTITHPHGSGIIAQTSHRSFDIPFDVEVSGNTISKDGYGLMDDKNALRVTVGDSFKSRAGSHIVVKNNVVSGYRRPTLTIGDRSDDPVAVFENNDITDLPLAVKNAEMQQGDDDFTDITADVTLAREGLSNRNDVSGQTVAQFSLSSQRSTIGYTEITLSCDPSLARDGEIVELYRTNAWQWAWKPYGYYQVHDGSFTFELGSESDLGKFAIVNKTPAPDKIATDIASLSGSTGDAKLMNAISTGGFYTASDTGTITVPRHYMNNENPYASNLDLRNLNLYCSDTSDNNGFTFASNGGNDFYFENCMFDHLDIAFMASGMYAFHNCTFEKYPYCATAVQASDAHLFFYDCTFKDNAPDRDIWNNNPGGRYSKYSAIRLRGNSTSMHARGCTFKNLQTDTSIHVQKYDGGYENIGVYFEDNTMDNCGGHGLCLDNPARGRVDGNTFTNVGGTRGMNGYKSTIDPTLGETGGKPGAGVGGNAVFAREDCLQMRVRNNTCVNLMENGIEGTYYCISGNHIDTTGYRYDDPTGDSYNGGYKTVSTEGIAADGTWYVTDNTVLNVHGRGIGITYWHNHPILIENNVVTRRANGHPGDDTSEGIKIRTDETSWANVTVRNNKLSGFINNYRILHLNDPDKLRTCENVVIEDINNGKIMGEVMSHVRGVKLTTNRDVALPFASGAIAWGSNDLSSLTDEQTADGTHFVRMVSNGVVDSKGAARGRMHQTFELPDETCIVCLELKVRSSSPRLNVYVTSTRLVDDGNGGQKRETYPSGDGGSYSQYKVPLGGVSGLESGEFTTLYACLKAHGTTELGLFVQDAGQTIDVASVNGWYAKDAPQVFSISYDLDGGVLAAGTSNPTSYTMADTFELANPTKEGYTFAGWSGTGINGTTMSASVAEGTTGNLTFRAHWTALTETPGAGGTTGTGRTEGTEGTTGTGGTDETGGASGDGKTDGTAGTAGTGTTDKTGETTGAGTTDGAESGKPTGTDGAGAAAGDDKTTETGAASEDGKTAGAGESTGINGTAGTGAATGSNGAGTTGTGSTAGSGGAGTTPGPDDTPKAKSVTVVPVYQVYDKRTHDRYLTASTAKVKSAIFKGYSYEGIALYSVKEGTSNAKKIYQYVGKTKKSKFQHRYGTKRYTGFKKKGGVQFYAPKSGKKCYEWKKKVGKALEYRYGYKKRSSGWKKTGKYVYAV